MCLKDVVKQKHIQKPQNTTMLYNDFVVGFHKTIEKHCELCDFCMWCSQKHYKTV